MSQTSYCPQPPLLVFQQDLWFPQHPKADKACAWASPWYPIPDGNAHTALFKQALFPSILTWKLEMTICSWALLGQIRRGTSSSLPKAQEYSCLLCPTIELRNKSLDPSQLLVFKQRRGKTQWVTNHQKLIQYTVVSWNTNAKMHSYQDPAQAHT